MSETELPRVVVLISGRGSNCRAIFQAIADGRIRARLCAVISDRADAAGLVWAAETGLDTVTVERRRYPGRRKFEAALGTAIDGFDPDWIVLAGFMRVLGADFVNHYLGRMINIHPSLLPKHRGLDTHRRVLEAGEREHGASVHFVTPDLDSGPVISQVLIDVGDHDDEDRLADRLLPLEHRLYPATLALLIHHSVELRNETIHLDDKPLDSPLVLGRDLDDHGRLDGSRAG